MNDEERRIISDFVARIAGGGAPQAAGPWGGGSVPQTRPNLPPVDRDADALIADLFTRHPEARYRITQTAFVQEAALVEAQNRIRQLEWEVDNARRQGQAQAQPASGGFLGGLFGGGRQQPQQAAPMPPPPQPQYPPGYQPGMLQQRSGPGFLGTALTTAAGVAGGMVLGNALMNMFSGSHGAAHAANAASGGLFGGNQGGNAPELGGTSSPWTNPQQDIASSWQETGGQASGGWQQDGGMKSGWGNQDANQVSYDQGSSWGGEKSGWGEEKQFGGDDAGAYDDGGSDEA